MQLRKVEVIPYQREWILDFKNPIIKELEQEAKNWSNKREESR
jgi:hypothetical protein